MKRTTTRKKRADKPQYDMSHVVAIVFIIIAITITLLFTSYPG